MTRPLTFLLIDGWEYPVPETPAGARPQRVGSPGPRDVAAVQQAPAGLPSP